MEPNKHEILKKHVIVTSLVSLTSQNWIDSNNELVSWTNNGDYFGPDSGDVIWGEKNVSLIKKSESEIANLGVGRKFQKPTVFEDQSVMENLIMALKNKRNPWSVLFYKYNKIDLECLVFLKVPQLFF